jgi:hypothetical protein
MQPALYPAFDPAVTDYVVRCEAGTPVRVAVATPATTAVAIDGQPPGTGAFTTQVSLAPGQAFPLRVAPAGMPAAVASVRCLPADFPQWSVTRFGTPQAGAYVVAPGTGGSGAKYVAIFDTNGVPVWWVAASQPPNGFDATVLATGDIAQTDEWGGNEVYALNGALVAQPHVVAGRTGVVGNVHEFQVLPNGNYLLIGQYGWTGDLSAIGGAASGVFLDNVIQEVDPSGSLVWQWDAADHIPFTEIPPRWWSTVLASPSVADPYHMNSLAWDHGKVLVSFRHLDAIYEIETSTGSIVWKLGGVARTESLTPLGDPDATPLTANGEPYTNVFGGQHDARVLTDGTVTVSDNQTLLAAPPRGVRYQVDLPTRTATWLEQVADPPTAPASRCCGSATKLPGGNWVVDWGDTPDVEELSASGSPAFRLTFASATVFSYRGEPVLPAQFSAADLRTGMDEQYPR